MAGSRVVPRFGRKAAAAIAGHPGAAPMDFTSRVMHNFICHEHARVPRAPSRAGWLAVAVAAVEDRAEQVSRRLGRAPVAASHGDDDSLLRRACVSMPR